MFLASTWWSKPSTAHGKWVKPCKRKSANWSIWMTSIQRAVAGAMSLMSIFLFFMKWYFMSLQCVQGLVQVGLASDKEDCARRPQLQQKHAALHYWNKCCNESWQMPVKVWCSIMVSKYSHHFKQLCHMCSNFANWNEKHTISEGWVELYITRNRTQLCFFTHALVGQLYRSSCVHSSYI